MPKGQNSKKRHNEIPIEQVNEFSTSIDKSTQQRIAEKAYGLYECHGCCDGRDLDDWLEAERLVLADIEPQNQSESQKQ